VKTGNGLLAIFLVGLCKWLLGLAISQRPPSRVEVKSVIGYCVHTGIEHEDLISIAFRFDPTFAPPNDALGLANNSASAPDECSLSVPMFKRVAKRKNADTILAKDAKLQEEMIASTASLLEVARYDVIAFRTWFKGE
jgi:hypothetical protein